MTGWKTYLFFFLTAVVSTLQAMGIIGEQLGSWLIGLLVPAGAIALRSAVGRVEKKTEIAADAATTAASVSIEAASTKRTTK